MNILESVHLTYNYLCEVYELTKFDYIKKKYIKPEKYKGHNVKSLVQQKLLVEYKNAYKWNGAKPQYFTAYNYYYAVRGKKKTYDDVLKILENPENYNTNDLIEAIGIKGAQETSVGVVVTNEEVKSTNLKIHDIITKEFCTNNEEKKPDVFDERFLNLEKKLDVILLQINSFQNGYQNDSAILIDLLKQIIVKLMENAISIKNSQNSMSANIAILKTVQENLFDIVIGEQHTFKALYGMLIELVKEHPEIEEYHKRKELIGMALQAITRRVEANAEIIRKYGNGNSTR